VNVITATSSSEKPAQAAVALGAREGVDGAAAGDGAYAFAKEGATRLAYAAPITSTHHVLATLPPTSTWRLTAAPGDAGTCRITATRTDGATPATAAGTLTFDVDGARCAVR